MIVAANALLAELFGYSLSDLVGSSVLILVPQRFHERVPLPSLGERIVGKRRIHAVGVRRDHTEFPAEISIGTVETAAGPGFLAAIRDVSERRLTEIRSLPLLEPAPEAQLVFNRAGTIVVSNELARELLGCSQDELGGQPFRSLFPERLRPAEPFPPSEWFTSPRSRIQRGDAPVYLTRKDGSEIPVDVSFTPLETPTGTLAVARFRDATGQVAAQEELLQHLSDLAHVTRLSTMGEMVAGLAHELNQPLYAISNYARSCEVLARSGDPSRRMEEVVEKLIAQTQRASEIVRRLRRFVSRREPRRFAVDINHLVREVQQLMLFHAHRFSIRTRLVLAGDLPKVWADAILIEQVLVNLVRNAFEAMGDGRSADPDVLLATDLDEEGMVRLRVIDNGPGFEGISFDHLFEAFYTTKEQGMGLGLPISRSIVEAHGGRLSASSTPGRGATFTVTLPVFREASRE